MQKLTAISKFISTICSVMVGVGVSLFFLQDLLPLGQQVPVNAFSHYALLLSDWTASIVAGVLAGWLIRFCLWDCLAGWLGALLAKTGHAGDSPRRASTNRAEQPR